MSKTRVVGVTAGAAAAIRRGHPWIWREAVSSGTQGLATGDVVEVRSPVGEPLGQAIWDETSPIAARLYAHSVSPALEPGAIVREIDRAIGRRAKFAADAETSAYRLCNGEGDRVPGIVIDLYDDVAVLRLDGAAMAAWISYLGPGIWELLRRRGIRSLAHRSPRRGEGTLDPLFGEPPPESLTVREYGVLMVVDLARGQKTGAFLDQRDNRARVRGLSAGRRVLNLFSYAGGFSTAAVLGGAQQVTSVDTAQAAHAAAELSMRANGIDPAMHSFITADAFAFLAAAAERQSTWDLVICDPPSFAPSEKAKARALTSYRKLHAACAAVLAPHGILCAASCSSHVTPEEFVATLDDSALGRSDLTLVAMFGLPADHPTLPAWPEGRYLKFAILR
jgi:23S rRNA (cytosine1962-C5)-methyltransferase